MVFRCHQGNKAFHLIGGVMCRRSYCGQDEVNHGRSVAGCATTLVSFLPANRIPVNGRSGYSFEQDAHQIGDTSGGTAQQEGFQARGVPGFIHKAAFDRANGKKCTGRT